MLKCNIIVHVHLIFYDYEHFGRHLKMQSTCNLIQSNPIVSNQNQSLPQPFILIQCIPNHYILIQFKQTKSNFLQLRFRFQRNSIKSDPNPIRNQGSNLSNQMNPNLIMILMQSHPIQSNLMTNSHLNFSFSQLLPVPLFLTSKQKEALQK